VSARAHDEQGFRAAVLGRLHFPYGGHTANKLAAEILRKPMRAPLLVLLVFLLAVPAAAAAVAVSSADGELSVDSGRGKVTVDARGGIIGRFTDGRVYILDLTPEDAFDPVIFGNELPSLEQPNGAVVHRGTNVRFRLVGGRYFVRVTGVGIDLSAVGNGNVWLESDGSRFPGTYSVDGDDCQLARTKCKPLPELRTRFKLGSGDATVPRPPD
jgi:hypothetical protein